MREDNAEWKPPPPVKLRRKPSSNVEYKKRRAAVRKQRSRLRIMKKPKAPMIADAEATPHEGEPSPPAPPSPPPEVKPKMSMEVRRPGDTRQREARERVSGKYGEPWPKWCQHSIMSTGSNSDSLSPPPRREPWLKTGASSVTTQEDSLSPPPRGPPLKASTPKGWPTEQQLCDLKR